MKLRTVFVTPAAYLNPDRSLPCQPRRKRGPVLHHSGSSLTRNRVYVGHCKLVSFLSTLYIILQSILLQSIFRCSLFAREHRHVQRTLFRQTVYIVKTANAPTSPNPRYTFKPAPVFVAALAFVSAVLPPLLVPVALPVVALPA